MDASEIGNGLSQEMTTALMESLDQLADEPALKVLLICGRPEVFCSGATLETLEQIATGDVAVKDLALPARLLSFPTPVIAALQGAAVGGGLALALYCDITVAALERRYGFNFTALGFTPGMGTTALLPALIGHSQAGEMLLSAKFYTGQELQRWNLFTHIVPAAEVYPLALDLALRMAEKSRQVLTLTKAALVLPRRQALQNALAREDLMHQICFADPETLVRIKEMFLTR
jgi:polyketide biosynthesis enoyl-CoA hydratase PksI